jgi:hypothetical protein
MIGRHKEPIQEHVRISDLLANRVTGAGTCTPPADRDRRQFEISFISLFAGDMRAEDVPSLPSMRVKLTKINALSTL